MTHKEWLDNEYQQWVKALQESTVDNFQQNPIVRRMLSLDTSYPFDRVSGINIQKIGRLGLGKWMSAISQAIWRMAYYAEKVLEQKPKAIVEIGGGVGQFYAVLRALGYKGVYAMYDLPEVMDFQLKYLTEVEKITGLKCSLISHDSYFSDWEDRFCVSFYAFGEFTDETKDWHIANVISKCPHGMMVFNPHSGASDKINFKCKVEDEYPLTSPGNKFITW